MLPMLMTADSRASQQDIRFLRSHLFEDWFELFARRSPSCRFHQRYVGQICLLIPLFLHMRKWLKMDVYIYNLRIKNKYIHMLTHMYLHLYTYHIYIYPILSPLKKQLVQRDPWRGETSKNCFASLELLAPVLIHPEFFFSRVCRLAFRTFSIVKSLFIWKMFVSKIFLNKHSSCKAHSSYSIPFNRLSALSFGNLVFL
jgi:hypothetical protein